MGVYIRGMTMDDLRIHLRGDDLEYLIAVGHATDVPDKNVGELINRQAAIEWVKTECNPYGKPTLDFESGKKVIEYLKQMPPAQKWIPCSERLPEVNERCLCTYEFNEGTCVDFGLYTKRGWFVSGVTAWMPLPDPYKAERSEDA